MPDELLRNPLPPAAVHDGEQRRTRFKLVSVSGAMYDDLPNRQIKARPCGLLKHYIYIIYNIYIYIYIYIYLFIYLFIHIYIIFVFIFICICICISISISIFMFIFIYLFMYRDREGLL